MLWRSLAVWLLGIWIGCSLFMVTVATRNFRMVDHVLQNPAPGFDKILENQGTGEARMFLRYLASELNRWYFETWEWCQLGIAAMVAVLTVYAVPRQRLPISLALLLLAIVVVERFALTPQIVHLGRLIDFAPPDAGESRESFWRYHHWYSGLEVTKMLVGVALTAILLRQDPRGR